MVFKEKIKAQLKAYVRFLREEGDVPVKEIVHRCGISRASLFYRCLKSANRAQKKSKKHMAGLDQSMCSRKGARLREPEGNFSCHVQNKGRSGFQSGLLIEL